MVLERELHEHAIFRRRVFSFHRPDTLDQWLTQELQHPASTLRAKLRSLPQLIAFVFQGCGYALSLYHPALEALPNFQANLLLATCR